MFETLSFLPPLDEEAIAKQIDYIIRNNWTPCLEFSEAKFAYVASDSTNHVNGPNYCNYFDNRLAPFDGSTVGLATVACSCDFNSLLLQVLDYVQAAHVRLHRRRSGDPGD